MTLFGQLSHENAEHARSQRAYKSARIKDDNFGFAVHYDTNMDRLAITSQHMTAKPNLSSFILFLMHLI